MKKLSLLLLTFVLTLAWSSVGCVVRRESTRVVDPETGEVQERERQTEVRGAAPRFGSSSDD